MNDELGRKRNGHDLFQGTILAFSAGAEESKTPCSSQNLNQTPHECQVRSITASAHLLCHNSLTLSSDAI